MFPDMADWYDEIDRWQERLRSGRNGHRHDIPFEIDGSDASAFDAEVMPFEEWVKVWRLDHDTDQMVMA